MLGTGGWLAVAVAEARARRDMTESGRAPVDARGDRVDAFDAGATPLPGYAPLARPERPLRWWRRRRG
ncbi:hypothetical protein CMsap09_01550 [Clavibacter michiganensis]|uniref:Uncharacterized protein n=1 Tax=Clavibacter michiganensis TaxID=28447 RepID=A0A251XPV8_9MICO|nr:hypothetical protein CMsap09_01550 [Clavibacter michiganensis]